MSCDSVANWGMWKQWWTFTVNIICIYLYTRMYIIFIIYYGIYLYKTLQFSGVCTMYLLIRMYIMMRKGLIVWENKNTILYTRVVIEMKSIIILNYCVVIYDLLLLYVRYNKDVVACNIIIILGNSMSAPRD